MLSPNPSNPTNHHARICFWTAMTLIVMASIARLLYLINACPLDLAPDEAHYWDWSRHLDWSYYSKGPLIAWIIRGSCELFGAWSTSLIGNEMIAVRLPAVLCGGLLLLALYLLTVQVYHDERLGLAVVLLGLTIPVLAAGSILMTIDSPYTCCWAWALVLTHRAIFKGGTGAWVAAGLVTALGILAKHNMVLFVPAVGIFLLTSKEQRPLLRQRGFWIMAGVAALGGLPILWWNVQNGWVTFLHVKEGNIGKRVGIQWLGPLYFVGGQMALLLVVWFLAWGSAMWVHRPWQESDAGKRYLWWTSITMFAVFLAFSFKTGGGELNWPVASYLSGMVLTAGWVVAELKCNSALRRRVMWASSSFAAALGVLLIVASHRSDFIRPILLSISGPAKPERPFPLRRFDPTCRLRGWQTLCKEVDRLREDLRAKGIEPVLAATSWAMPGEIGFYCQGNPTVYSLGIVQFDRHSQYDLWRPNPIRDGENFRGRTFIIVNLHVELMKPVFKSIEDSRMVIYSEGANPICNWTLSVCHDFQGFPDEIVKKNRY